MNTFLENWRKFWGQLGPNQRVSVSLSFLLVVAAMVGILLWAQRPDMRLLYGSVSPKDAAAIIEHLDGQGIPYEMRSGGSAIFVPADQVYRARMDVVSQGLVQGDAVGFEIFDKSSFGISDFVQRTNFIRAVQGELARTIRQLNGVRHARVMVVVPDNRLLLVNKNVETTASVFVDVGGGQLADGAVRSIQSLVANAVEGLRVDKVAVIDNRGVVLSKEPEEEGLMGGSNSLVEYRQNLERYFSDKVESMLERVVGPGNAVVRVAAEIDSTQVSRMQEDFNEDAAALRRQTSREELSTSTQPGGGVASLEVNEGDSAVRTSNPTESSEEARDREQAYEIDRVVTNTIEGPGKVRRLTASVFIASTVRAPAEEGGEPLVESRTPEQMESLRAMVANALGIPLDDPVAGSVAIEEVVFDMPIGPEMLAASAGGFEPMQLLQFGKEIVGGIIALIIFLVFLNLLKRSSRESSLLEHMAQTRRTSRSGVDLGETEMVTPELLNELIRQKPENAAATLRNWLSGKVAE